MSFSKDLTQLSMSTNVLQMSSTHILKGEDLEILDLDMERKILLQVEHFFSDDVLFQDKFLTKLILRNKDRYVCLKLVSSLRKVQKLTKDWRVVSQSLKQSVKLELNEKCNKVRRVVPMYLGTAIVFNIPAEVQTSDDVIHLLKPIGTVSHAKLMSWKCDSMIPPIKRQMKLNKPLSTTTFALAKFVNVDDCAKAINCPPNLIKGSKIVTLLKEEDAIKSPTEDTRDSTPHKEADGSRETPFLSNDVSSIRNRSYLRDPEHYSIFIGDLSPEIETAQLREAFTSLGEIADCRVVRDPQTSKSKGYGFVSFVKKADAETAITTMNGQWLGSRAIRTNWATRKPPANRSQNEYDPKREDAHIMIKGDAMRQDMLCVIEEADTKKEEMEPMRNEVPILGEEMEPMRNEVPILGEEKEPMRNEVPILGEEMASVRNEVPILGEEMEPMRNEVPILGEEMEPMRNEVPILGEEMEPMRNEVPILGEEMEPMRYEVPILGEEMEPMRNEVPILGEEMEPIREVLLILGEEENIATEDFANHLSILMAIFHVFSLFGSVEEWESEY